MRSAISRVVQTALLFLDGLSESSHLVLLGFGLIFGALVLRKFLLPGHVQLVSTSRADARAK